MKYCSVCGSEVHLEIPAGDSRERHVCGHCGTIHYVNPNIITGCLVRQGDQVMLCKRSIEPRSGYWTLPAGFMENGESAEDGAARETWEEACAQVEPGKLYTLFSIPRINQVYMIFMADLDGGSFAPGEESEAVELFKEDDIPWANIAFPAMYITLKHFFEDIKTGNFETRSQTLNETDWQRLVDLEKS